MENLRNDKILTFNDDTLEAVRKTFELDKPGVMEDAVTILEEWVKQQRHFTKKSFDRRYLEAMIIASKGSIERAKARLDRMCTFRTMKPEFFCSIDIRSFCKTNLNFITHAVLPKMTKNNERVYLIRNVGQRFESTFINDFLRVLSWYAEYIRINDYAASTFFVVDNMETNLLDLARKMTISDVRDVVEFLMDCCGFKLKAAVFITSSNLIETIISIAKQVVSDKIGKRIHVVKTREEIQKFIDKDVLPEEYGGNDKSLEELHEQWLDVLTSKDYMEYFKDMSSARTDESLRQKDAFNDQYMGMSGTFRTLCVD